MLPCPHHHKHKPPACRKISIYSFSLEIHHPFHLPLTSSSENSFCPTVTWDLSRNDKKGSFVQLSLQFSHLRQTWRDGDFNKMQRIKQNQVTIYWTQYNPATDPQTSHLLLHFWVFCWFLLEFIEKISNKMTEIQSQRKVFPLMILCHCKIPSLGNNLELWQGLDAVP